jgi:O-antigen ligase
MLIPQRWIDRSEFLTSISYRSLGAESIGGVLDQRLWSLALHPSSASMVCLVLIPVAAWGAWRGSGWTRMVSWVSGSGLLVTLVLTESRAAWAAFAAGSMLAAFLVAIRTTDIRLRLLIVSGTMSVGMVVAATAGPSVVATVQRLVIEIRPESWVTRLELYRETVEMLGEHPIAGWGHAVERPGRRRVFSAGTHSAILGMLFQHGVVGLALYLALWASIWWTIIRRLLASLRSGSKSGDFWIVAAVAMFAFNIRETVDNWWWDQLVTTVVWCFWGLIVTAPSVFRRPAATPGDVRHSGGEP